MTREVINELKKYTVGKKNTEKTEISVLALNRIIFALEEQELKQEYKTDSWNLDDAREDFMFDVYNILDFLPTNNETNRIIDIFDRVTSGIEQESILDKIKAEIESKMEPVIGHYDSAIPIYNMPSYKIERNAVREECIEIIDKYRRNNNDTSRTETALQ